MLRQEAAYYLNQLIALSIDSEVLEMKVIYTKTQLLESKQNLFKLL